MIPRGTGRSGFYFLMPFVCLGLLMLAFLNLYNIIPPASALPPQQTLPELQKPSGTLRIPPQERTDPKYTGAMVAVPQSMRRVPDVKGLTLEEAAKTLSIAKLRLGEATYGNYGAPAGKVAIQSPDAGLSVEFGTAVKVWVDREPALPPPPLRPAASPKSGQRPVEVPDLRSHGEMAAQLILRLRGLRYGGAKKVGSETEKPGSIFDQDPKPGTQVPKGTLVTVSVAVGKQAEPPIEVPKLLHHSREEAAQMLQQVGLQASNSEITEKRSEEETGIVLSQFPLAGTRVARGTSVSFVVSRQIERSLVLRSTPASVVPGEPVVFTAELDPPFTGTTFQFNFGEGPGTGELDLPRASHSYSGDGDYEVFVIAKVNGKQLVSNRVLVPVHRIPLKITLVPNRDHGTTNETIEFHALATPPAPRNAKYTFDFGDGEQTQTSGSPDARHFYTQRGTYSAWVRVSTVHEPLAGGPAAHEHQFVSERVPLSIVPPLPGVLIAAAVTSLVLVGSGVFLGYRWYMTRKVEVQLAKGAGSQRLEAPAGAILGVEVQFRGVRSPGEQTLVSRGPLWTRIETIHD
jgi:beta-lactam-binding protein with PASTA domain